MKLFELFQSNLSEMRVQFRSDDPDVDDEELELIAKHLKENCQPYFRQWAPHHYLYRGIEGEFTSGIFTTRKQREPSDTPLWLHNALNELFEKKFGWKVRDGVFATHDTEVAQHYGDAVYCIFPVGEFEYVWSPHVADFYTAMEENLKEWQAAVAAKDYTPIAEWIEKAEYTNKGLRKLATANESRYGTFINEISIKCEKYYAIRATLMVDLDWDFITSK